MSYRQAIFVVQPLVPVLVNLTGWPDWFARNILAWRASHGLPLGVSKTVE